MPSFDVVSEVDAHELKNAIDQANRELEIRFDFKNTGAKFELADYIVTMEAPSDFQLKQMLDILIQKVSRRGIDVNAITPMDPDISLSRARQNIQLRHGIDADSARKIAKLVKASKLKVQAAIQGEQVRVTGKKRDDLQNAIQMLKKAGLGLPLQFTNFRD
jgi:uncharacterized protein YajQ (UPF0234 family)